MFYSKFADDYEQIFPYRENIHNFIKSYQSNERKSILDIGCATGHYCGKFASEGNTVTGIDLDSEMINSAIKNYDKAEFKVLNLTDIGTLNSQFNIVYSTGNVMAHVPLNEFQTFLQSLKGILSKDSIWIYQVINWDYILTLKEFDFPVIETDTKIFQRKYTNISSNSLLFHTDLINKGDGNSVFKDQVIMYPASSDLYIKMHEKAGFKLLGHFADYSKTPFSSTTFSADIYVFKMKN